MEPTTRILNIDVMRITRRRLLQRLSSGTLFTPNVDHFVKLRHDKQFHDAYTAADWVVCDSRIVYFASKLLRSPLPEAIPGSSFFHDFCDYHGHDPDCKIFILGGREGIADRARDNINLRIGRDMVVGTCAPPPGFEYSEAANHDVIQAIARSGASVLAVCLGAPRQEIWIHRNRHALPSVKIFMALGATVDFEAQAKKRAPAFWQKTGMEWFYRFLQEPRRLFARYFIRDPRFFVYFLSFLVKGR